MGPCVSASIWAIHGVPPSSSHAMPSRASSLQLVTLTTVAAMPSAASSVAALTASVRIAPEPMRVTRFSDEIGLSRSSSKREKLSKT